ncbi:transposase [Sphingomonas sp. ZT3P38]|uniref:transposase n=1 Tax=Parasphingomonas zepuensis TaxID=3096161 RepID=UPI002FC9E298
MAAQAAQCRGREGSDQGGQEGFEIWPGEPARAAQKDTDARWTLKFAKGRPAADGKPQIDIAIPSFGYKSSISICRAFGFIRKGKVTDGARFDGRMLRDVVTNDNSASDVWADTAYRSQVNEKWLKAHGRVSRIHRRKPRGKPMPDHVRRGNATKSKVRARVEHVFAHQKAIMGLIIKRAEAQITLANLAYMNRLIFHERRTAMG